MLEDEKRIPFEKTECVAVLKGFNDVLAFLPGFFVYCVFLYLKNYVATRECILRLLTKHLTLSLPQLYHNFIEG